MEVSAVEAAFLVAIDVAAVLFAGAAALLFVVAGRVLEVVVLLPLLVSRSLLSAFAAAVVFGRLVRPAPTVDAAAVIFLTVVARFVFAFSTSVATGPVVAVVVAVTNVVCLKGETERAKNDLAGDKAGRTGDFGSVREFIDLGDSTWLEEIFARAVAPVDAAAFVVVLTRFFGLTIAG